MKETEKLEKLLEEVANEMTLLYEKGYTINIDLPTKMDKGCSLSVYKPKTIVKKQYTEWFTNKPYS